MKQTTLSYHHKNTSWYIKGKDPETTMCDNHKINNADFPDSHTEKVYVALILKTQRSMNKIQF